MKLLLFVTALSLSFSANARDFGDKDCNIYVVRAGNVITGGHGNWLSATVAVSKDLIARDFQRPVVRIQGSENVAPTEVKDGGSKLLYVFTNYRRGIEYHGNSASVVAFISNGIDRLFDNNDNVDLVQRYNWQYTNPRCNR
ncbi:MAG: hypothetical protein ABL958_14695 [Bdellovibrionia bacterium]